MQHHFFSISETDIARYLKISPQQVQKQLERLQELNVLLYERQKNKPQLTFLTPRYEASRLPLNRKQIEQRKKRDLDQVEALISYVEHQHRCRALLLSEYFGEVSYANCGICDICLKRKSKDNPPEKLSSLRERVKASLETGPLAPAQLVSKVGGKSEQETLQAIRTLLDYGELAYLEDGRLTWKK